MKHTLISTTALFVFAFAFSGCSPNSESQSAFVIAPAEHDGHQDEPAKAEDHSDEGSHDDHGDEREKGTDIVKLSPDAANEAGVMVSQVTRGLIGQSLNLPAEIRFDADRIANVSPKVSGIIGKLYAGEGDTVRAGQSLALIKSRELAALKAAWQTAKTNEVLAAQALKREEKLWADKITSEADLQTARATFQAAKASSDAAENELHAAGVSHTALEKIETAADGDNANAYLSAPIAGKIVRRTVSLGETVSAGDAGAKPLFTIVDDSVVWADIAVYKQDISRIRVGAAVALKTDSGEVVAQSNVAFILPVISETSRTATARVIVDNSDGILLPGQFVTADLGVGSPDMVLRVPETAVQLVEDKPAVFVPAEGGFTPRPVLLGAKAGGYVEIRSGLKAGDNFVSGGAFTLKAQLEKDAFGDGHGH